MLACGQACELQLRVGLQGRIPPSAVIPIWWSSASTSPVAPLLLPRHLRRSEMLSACTDANKLVVMDVRGFKHKADRWGGCVRRWMPRLNGAVP